MAALHFAEARLAGSVWRRARVAVRDRRQVARGWIERACRHAPARLLDA